MQLTPTDIAAPDKNLELVEIRKKLQSHGHTEFWNKELNGGDQLSMHAAERFDDVRVLCKANIYFDGKVVSHTILFKDGREKTVGMIFPGSFTFNTEAPERMEIIAGSCRVKQAGADRWTPYGAGTFFLVPGKSSFEIAVEEGIA